MREEKMCLFVCKSCGGEIVADENTAATECPYCNNPVVMSGRLSGTLKTIMLFRSSSIKIWQKQTLKALYEEKEICSETSFKTENKR
jgi:DNA-directed RNA polymerase subunit RPC12/RpoP